MKIILKTLTLKNFKGIRDLTVSFGYKTSVKGDNAAGKTTLFDAFTWLLFDKDSLNQSNFNIKTIDSDNNVIHNLSHEVEGAFEIDGSSLTSKKVFAEKWTKKRGSATQEFSGHTTDYFIDGVPVKKKEYESRIAEIVNEDIFKLLTNPTYFNEQLHWQKRREILLSVAGDISDADVIASDKTLTGLPEILNGRALDDHKKVIDARRKELNKELDKLPVRIDEANRSLPDIAGIDSFTVSTQIAGSKAKLQDKYQEVNRIQNGGEVAEKTKQLREIEGRLLDIRNKHRAETDNKIQAKRSELLELKSKISELKSKIKNNQQFIQSNQTSIDRLERYTASLREDWHVINNKQFEHSDKSNCPTCGQALPEEQLAEAREKALANFNLLKSKDLEAISEKGKQGKADIDRLKAENIALQKEIDDMTPELEKLQQHASGLQSEIDSMVQSAPSITDNQEYVQAIKQKESLEAQIASAAADTTNLVAGIKEEIRLIENEISELEKQLALVDQYKRGQERIAELKQQEKMLAAEFEKLESELYLCEQFIRAKVAMLEEKINGCFKFARFKLFDEQINGGLTETCQTTFNGVPYNSLNNAAKVQVGCDILSTLQKHFDLYCPVFIDNRESVVRLPEMDCQVISLIVSDQHKSLHVEIEN